MPFDRRRPAFPVWPATVIFALVGFAALAGEGSHSAPSPVVAQEHDVKAAFLYHFTRYIQRPPPARSGAFRIAVLGDSPILPRLHDLAAKRTVSGRPIEVVVLPNSEAVDSPDILFLPAPASFELLHRTRRVAGRGVLTVAEEPGATLRGAAISLVIRQGTVRFEVNERVLRDSGFVVSSQLLRLAVPPGGEP